MRYSPWHMKNQKAIADKIRDQIKAKGYSNIERFADDIGMSRTYLSNFLNCRKGASLESLERIADSLKVKLKDLMPD